MGMCGGITDKEGATMNDLLDYMIKNIPPPPSGYTYDFDNPEIRKVGDNWEVTVNLCLKDEFGRLITIEKN